MNRLIILGNGFDLAHGLPTQYSHFIKNFWNSMNNTHTGENKLIEITGRITDLKQVNNSNDLINQLDILTKINHYGIKYSFSYKNKFFEKLEKSNIISNWVDIEMEYYKELKDYIKNDYDVINLNNEINSIKDLFERYLIENVVPEINKSHMDVMRQLFVNKPIRFIIEEYFLREFPKAFVKNYLEGYLEDGITLNDSIPPDRLVKNKTQFLDNIILNFNYTNTVNQYLESVGDFTLINIHGEIGNKKNSINLGFGDEMDSFYNEIEKKNDNEFLRFIKSFHYSNTVHYKKLFDYLEENYFQVQIMGHSCGLSDRTLLNSIFEHSNCKSIKVFYHEYKDENGNLVDNYSDIVKNISRHFNKKPMMREKIVNKEYCEPLPQIKKV